MIPKGIFVQYYEFVDELLSNPEIRKVATLYYEIKNETLPSEFNDENSTNLEIEEINVRAYYSPKNWLKIGSVEFVAGRVQIFGKLEDAPKLRKCSFLTIEENKYKLTGELLPHGFGHKYFIGYLDLI